MGIETRLVASHSPVAIIGTSPVMREVLELARKGARSSAAVLLLGESGTGKRTLGENIHGWSPRQAGPLVRGSCGGATESALERDLFSVPTGELSAGRESVGKVEQARGGTLFLDEVHAAPPAVQRQLLRLVQERSFQPPGENRTIDADVRIIAASDRDMHAEVTAGRFREDLFWRLNVVPIYLPPLRRRREDIAPLVEHFVKSFCQLHGRPVLRVAADALAALQQYGWPGNVRELQNYIERAVVLADGNELTCALLPGSVSGQPSTEMGVFRGSDPKSLIEEFVHNEVSTANGDAEDLHARIVNPVERELIVQVMKLCNNVQKKAADRLGMNRNTLHKKLKEYGIES